MILFKLQQLNFKKAKYDLILKSNNLDFVIMKYSFMEDREYVEILKEDNIIFNNIDWKDISIHYRVSENFIKKFH